MQLSSQIFHTLVLAAATLAVTLAAPTATQSPSTGFTGKRLIQLSEEGTPAWMGESEMLKLYWDHTPFVDITETQDLGQPGLQEPEPVSIPSNVTQQTAVRKMFAVANTDMMKSFLGKFTEFNTRYFRSETGAQSSKFLFDTVKKLTETANPANLTISVTQVNHSFPQQSVVARIEGLNGNDETVIVGSHQDSVNSGSPMAGRSPGADDDGSGTATTLEAFRVLLASGYQPLRPVEFQWYAGEEGGLLGSAAIAQDYKKAGRKVAGMIQFDMTMVPSKSNPDIGLLTDFTSPGLTDLVEKLATEYTKIKVTRFKCGYGCSDHASWNRAGYPSAMPAESSNLRNNGNIHSTRDTLDTLDFEHGLELAKLAVGYVVEMSHQ